MAAIYQQVGIKSDLDNVYKALTTQEGVGQWWTKATGDFEAGGFVDFHFGDTVANMQVLQQNPSKIVWQCVDVNPEWTDTQIIFELKEDQGQTWVNFKHELWNEETELFAHCTTKWAVFLVSLKNYVENGEGHPYPNDIQINHL